MAEHRPKPGGLRIPVSIQLLPLALHLTPGLFLFRRDRDSDERGDAFREVFNTLSVVYESAALLKEPWTERWEQRADTSLPPKYREALAGNDMALAAAYDLRFATALLNQNRWRSKVRPLFETVDTTAWSRIERTLQQAPRALLAIQDDYLEAFRGDESGWIDHAVEQFDEVRRNLRAAERQDQPVAERVSLTTFGMVLAASRLSTNLLDRIREDVIEEQ